MLMASNYQISLFFPNIISYVFQTLSCPDQQALLFQVIAINLNEDTSCAFVLGGELIPSSEPNLCGGKCSSCSGNQFGVSQLWMSLELLWTKSREQTIPSLQHLPLLCLAPWCFQI